MTEWKLINGYGNKYEVSNTGLVRDCKSGRLLKQGHAMGYPSVTLYRNGVSRRDYVHRLVAIAFLPCPGEVDKFQVNHKDLDKTNNEASNLEWVTPVENMKHYWKMVTEGKAERKKLDKTAKQTIRDLYWNSTVTLHKIALQFGISITSIYQIVNQEEE